MSRILFTLFTILLVFSIYWLGGGDFERGTALASTAYLAFALAVFVWFYPGWESK